MMTPFDPKWDDFLDRMEGPEGCNFQESGKDFTFTCDNTPNRPIARRILARMGLSPAQIEQSLGYFSAYGGMCDCEIVFNVQNSFEAAMGWGRSKARGTTRKNPKRR